VVQAAGGPRRAGIAIVATAVAATVLLTSLALLAVGRITEDDVPSMAPDGAELASIPRGDDKPLAGRLWREHPGRIALLLHSFGSDQTEWDSAIEPMRAALEHPISILTLDFRGHGDSAGENRDLVGMVTDVHSAVRYVRAQGFGEVVLIGSSMGGAAAIVAAAEDPTITGVIALSAPAELGELDAVAAVRSLTAPLGLIAGAEDASAAESFRRLRDEAGDTAWMAVVYPGRAHGVGLVEGADGVEVRERIARAIDGLWEAEEQPGE
jgi:pimeloyl-ACP methyl ester carboxylesterase